MSIDPAVSLLLRGALALLLAAAAVHKLRDLGAFRTVLENYQLLPQAWVAIWAPLVPLLEASLLCGLLLPRTAAFAAAGVAILLLVYAGAIAVNLRAGRRDLDCGCLGRAGRRSLSGALVVRNLLLAAAALFATLPPGVRSLTWVDFITILAGGGVLGLAYVAIDGLIAHAAPLARLARGSGVEADSVPAIAPFAARHPLR